MVRIRHCRELICSSNICHLGSDSGSRLSRCRLWGRGCGEAESSETVWVRNMDLGTKLYILGSGLREPAGGGGWGTACVGAEKTLSAFK